MLRALIVQVAQL